MRHLVYLDLMTVTWTGEEANLHINSLDMRAVLLSLSWLWKVAMRLWCHIPTNREASCLVLFAVCFVRFLLGQKLINEAHRDIHALRKKRHRRPAHSPESGDRTGLFIAVFGMIFGDWCCLIMDLFILHINKKLSVSSFPSPKYHDLQGRRLSAFVELSRRECFYPLWPGLGDMQPNNLTWSEDYLGTSMLALSGFVFRFVISVVRWGTATSTGVRSYAAAWPLAPQQSKDLEPSHLEIFQRIF